jgi:hypothetical protein
MKTCGGVDVYLHQSSTRHKMEVNGQHHDPAPLPPEKEAVVPILYEVTLALKLVWDSS